MSMPWQELYKEALQLSVSNRLALVEAIVRSFSNELRPRQPLPEKVLERLRGSLKIDAPAPTDEEIEAILEQRLEEKYLK